jgi:hypothetical protein
MARAVLAMSITPHNLVALALIGLLAACGSGAKKAEATGKAGPLICTGDLARAPSELQSAYPPLRHRIEAGPLYQALAKRLGPPRSCARSVQAGGLRLAYEFPRNGVLVAQIDPRTEFSEQRVNLQGLDDAEAKSLLQAAETNAFGATGCGLNWERSVTEEPGSLGGSSEVVYRGDACNCQARVGYDDEKVIGLVLRSAC